MRPPSTHMKQSNYAAAARYMALFDPDVKAPSVIMHSRSRNIYITRHYVYGACHSLNDMPSVTYRSVSHVMRREWRQLGHYHRDGDCPAIMDRVRSEFIWYKHGVRHRDGNRPSRMTKEHMWFDGSCHLVRYHDFRANGEIETMCTLFTDFFCVTRYMALKLNVEHLALND